MIEKVMSWFSIWESVRSAGIVSFVLLSISVIGGIFSSLLPKNQMNARLQMFHQISGWFGFWFAVLHMALLFFDEYVGYTWTELIIPFASTHEKLWLGLGTTALWGLAVVLISSDLLKILKRKWWKRIHFLTIPVYLFSLLHGLFLGTDTLSPSIVSLYVLSGTLFLVALILRLRVALWGKANRGVLKVRKRTT